MSIPAPVYQPTALVNRYQGIRQQSEQLCEPLAIEDYVVQPKSEVSPPKWHLAHTTWLFEEVILKNFACNYQPFDEQYSLLFNSYYKSAGKHWLQHNRGQLSRPTVKEIYAYREYVDKAMFDLLNNDNLNDELLNATELALHHEQQHQELLLMDIKFILSCNPSLPTYIQARSFTSKQNNRSTWLHYPSDLYSIGNGNTEFCYDNETPQHKHYIEEFSLHKQLVSNGEYLEAMQSGIYTKPEYWLSMGWDWVNQEKIQHPMYWYYSNDQWYEYTLHGAKRLDLHEPVVHISYYEADAFARWKSCRLPTEHELEIFLSQEQVDTQRKPLENPFHPHNVDAIDSMAWCWTQSQYSPYPGYKPYKGMLAEYNGKFMCNQFVLRGGCIATPPGHYRPTYRNFYQPQQRWMFSGIRLAKDKT